MPKTTLSLGGVLVAVGVVGWLASGAASVTALIPAFLGLVIALLGWVALSRPKLGVHAALVVALLGIFGTIPNVLGLGDLLSGTAERPLAVVTGTITFVLLVAYVVAGVRSFVAVRRERAAA